MEGVEEIGKRGYEKQIWGEFDQAISIYTSAIKKFPNDSRLLNNRCLCYIEIKDYKRAMEDADNMILLFPNYKKSFYRKGEIFLKLMRYKEAEKCFQKVLQMDPDCEDAKIQLKEAQIIQLCKNGMFMSKQASQALGLTGNLEDAERLLLYGSLDAYLADIEGIKYYSDEENTNNVFIHCHKEYDPLLDPSNPLRSVSLWVGCISKGVTEQSLTSLFSKYGRVKSLKINNDKQSGYAFINFYDAVGPAKAMEHLQGHLLEGQNMIIKYPDNVKTNGLTALAHNKMHPKSK